MTSPRRRHLPIGAAFALPAALALSLFIFGVVFVATTLLRGSLAAPRRAAAHAKANALLALDRALADLAIHACADTVASANASLLGSVANPNWLGVWQDGIPRWLVSGSGSVHTRGNFLLLQDPPTYVELLQSPAGGHFAYAVSDNAQKSSTSFDLLDQLDIGYADSPDRLRRQLLLSPVLDNLSSNEISSASFGVLSNPLSGGLKVALDADQAPQDPLVAQSHLWRDASSFILGRPLIWTELALFMGVYRSPSNAPALGISFWADAWNPYTLELPFNPRYTPDFQLRLSGPSGLARFYTASGSLAGLALLDLASHTSAHPVDTDLYSTMAAGEIRFITHYRLLEIAPVAENITEVEISFPEGQWDFIFETFEGALIQKFTSIPYDAFSVRAPYLAMTASGLSPASSHWAFSWKRTEPLPLQQQDPRRRELPYTPAAFILPPDPVFAARSFSGFRSSDLYRDGASITLFDLPEGSVLSPSSLRHAPLGDAPALTLGSSAASSQNSILDSYFFSTLPSASELWPGSGKPLLPNNRLRLLGSPSLLEARANPAEHLLTRGAFNINTLSSQQWAAHIPESRHALEFHPSAQSTTTLTPAARYALATGIVERLRARGKPWPTLSAFAAEDLLPPDLLAQLIPILQPRGDTFVVHAYGSAPNSAAHARLSATVQRLPTSSTGRRFQVLGLSWQ